MCSRVKARQFASRCPWHRTNIWPVWKQDCKRRQVWWSLANSDRHRFADRSPMRGELATTVICVFVRCLRLKVFVSNGLFRLFLGLLKKCGLLFIIVVVVVVVVVVRWLTTATNRSRKMRSNELEQDSAMSISTDNTLLMAPWVSRARLMLIVRCHPSWASSERIRSHEFTVGKMKRMKVTMAFPANNLSFFSRRYYLLRLFCSFYVARQLRHTFVVDVMLDNMMTNAWPTIDQVESCVSPFYWSNKSRERHEYRERRVRSISLVDVLLIKVSIVSASHVPKKRIRCRSSNIAHVSLPVEHGLPMDQWKHLWLLDVSFVPMLIVHLA
jgi:hypothetical protein